MKSLNSFFHVILKSTDWIKKNIIRIMYFSTRQTLELNRQKQMKKFKLTDYRLVVNIFIICLGFFWAGTCCIVDIETDQCLILIGEMSAFGFFSFRSYIVCELPFSYVFNRLKKFISFGLKIFVHFPSISFVFSLNYRSLKSFFYHSFKFFLISLNDPFCSSIVRFFLNDPLL